jgi:hypothetical protein
MRRLVYDSGMKPPRMRFPRSFLIGRFAIFSLTILLLAETADFDGRPAIVLRNDKIELTILIRGATLANLVLRDDAEKLSPYWNMDRAQRAAGSPPARPGGSLGHFLCLDGFGAPSEEERTAGMPFHGEASGRQFEAAEESASGSGASNVKLKAHLPLAQEDISRTVTLIRQHGSREPAGDRSSPFMGRACHHRASVPVAWKYDHRHPRDQVPGSSRESRFHWKAGLRKRLCLASRATHPGRQRRPDHGARERNLARFGHLPDRSL